MENGTAVKLDHSSIFELSYDDNELENLNIFYSEGTPIMIVEDEDEIPDDIEYELYN